MAESQAITRRFLNDGIGGSNVPMPIAMSIPIARTRNQRLDRRRCKGRLNIGIERKRGR